MVGFSVHCVVAVAEDRLLRPFVEHAPCSATGDDVGEVGVRCNRLSIPEQSKPLFDRITNGDGDRLAGQLGELTGQAVSVGVLDVDCHEARIRFAFVLSIITRRRHGVTVRRIRRVDPLFVFLPSVLLGPAVWAPVADRLASRGRRVVVPEAANTAPRTPADVLDRYLAAVPQHGDVELVVHSNAGLYVPAIVEQRSNVVGTIFVDAGLPPTSGTVELAPPHLLAHLRSLADEHGRLPPWSAWFDDTEVAALFPDQTTRSTVEAEQQSIPLACLDATLPVPADWDDRPNAYLAFGDTYGPERTDATDRGWPVATIDGRHLHMLIDPDEVAETITTLADRTR